MPKKDENDKEQHKPVDNADKCTIEKENDKSKDKGERKTEKTKRQKLQSWFLIHVLLAFFVLFVTFFLIWNLIDVVQLVDAESQLQTNLVISLLFAIASTFFWDLFQILTKGMKWLMERVVGPKIEQFYGQSLRKSRLTPVEERLALRRHYYALIYCLLLLALIFMSFDFLSIYRRIAYGYEIRITAYSLYTLISFSCVMASLPIVLFCFMVVNDKEYSAFYVERCLERLEKREKASIVKDLSEGLRLYQESLHPIFKFKSLNLRLGQIQMVLDRASKTEYDCVVGILKRVYTSIENEKHEEFDTEFKKLIEFLDVFADSRKDIMEVNKITRKERIKAFFSPIAQPLVEKAVYTLINTLIIISLGVLFWYWFGIQYININT